MKTFSVACILAAGSIAVPIKEGALQESVVLNNLTAKVADKVEQGAITVIDGDTDILAEEIKDIAPAVED